jgi:hypothetical protein
LAGIADHARYIYRSVGMAAMKRHGHENNMMAIEARLNSAQENKRANEQRRANE